MASADLSRRVGKVVAYPPLSEMSVLQRREFHEALLDAKSFDDLPGKWQAAILEAEQNRPNLRVVSGDWSRKRRCDPLPRRRHNPQWETAAGRVARRPGWGRGSISREHHRPSNIWRVARLTMSPALCGEIVQRRPKWEPGAASRTPGRDPRSAASRLARRCAYDRRLGAKNAPAGGRLRGSLRAPRDCAQHDRGEGVPPRAPSGRSNPHGQGGAGWQVQWRQVPLRSILRHFLQRSRRGRPVRKRAPACAAPRGYLEQLKHQCHVSLSEARTYTSMDAFRAKPLHKFFPAS